MTRDGFAKWLYDNGHRRGVELGVERGKYTEILAKAGLEVIAVDSWTAYSGYRDHVSQEKLDGFLEETKKRVAGYNVKIIKGFSLDVVKQFEDESLDFVYIDANHEFQNVTNDIAEWSKKVKKGGVVSGHDFKRFGGKYGLNSCHVKDVVQAWVRSHQIDLKLTEESNPSWYWVK